MAAEAALAPFRVGMKEVYLYAPSLRPIATEQNGSSFRDRPSFSITLHRTRRLPANNATFTVPLWFSKLDLRDYLYHAYNVRILSVRSYIKLQRIRSGAPSYIPGEEYPRPTPRRWHRPKSHKRMTVELERPFVWPEEPTEEDYEKFNKKQVNMYKKETEKFQERLSPTKDTVINTERRESMREQAKALLEGRAKWKAVADKGFGSMPSSR